MIYVFTEAPLSFVKLLLLQFRRARTGQKNTPRPETRKKHKKKYKSPTLGWAPKIQKNYRKNTQMVIFKNGHFCMFSRPNPGWGIFVLFFSYFFRISGLGGFCALYEPDGIAMQLLVHSGSKINAKVTSWGALQHVQDCGLA